LGAAVNRYRGWYSTISSDWQLLHPAILIKATFSAVSKETQIKEKHIPVTKG
jgi:hypothetical protein